MALDRVEDERVGLSLRNARTAPAEAALARSPREGPSLEGAPPAGRLYVGEVMHLRLRPKRHQFRYRLATLLLDIDRLEETFAGLRLAALDGRAPVTMRLGDHGARDGSRLRPWVETQLAAAGLAPPDRILLLATPRVLGYAFNPLAVYYGYRRGADGVERLDSIVYQVKNTFGDQHVYALAAGPLAGGAHRQTCRKDFFVSPFIDMEKTYGFTATDPGARFGLRIKERDAAGDFLIATWSGRAAPLTDGALMRHFLLRPMMTRKVFAGIHWEALRLALKGVRFLGHPGDEHIRRTGVSPPPKTDR